MRQSIFAANACSLMPAWMSAMTSIATAESSTGALPQHLDLMRVLDDAQLLDDSVGRDQGNGDGNRPFFPDLQDRADAAGQLMRALHRDVATLDAESFWLKLLDERGQRFIVAAFDGYDLAVRAPRWRSFQFLGGRTIPKIENQVQPGTRDDHNAGRTQEVRKIEDVRQMSDDQPVKLRCLKSVAKLGMAGRQDVARSETHGRILNLAPLPIAVNGLEKPFELGQCRRLGLRVGVRRPSGDRERRHQRTGEIVNGLLEVGIVFRKTERCLIERQRVAELASAVMNVGEPSNRRQVFRRASQHLVELDLGSVEIVDFDQRTPKRHTG